MIQSAVFITGAACVVLGLLCCLLGRWVEGVASIVIGLFLMLCGEVAADVQAIRMRLEASGDATRNAPVD